MNRYGLLICAAVVGFVASLARAEVTFTENKDTEVTVVRMTVTPAAESTPALKYRLMPRDFGLQPGNAAPYYYRAMIELSPIFGKLRKQYGDAFDEWYDTDLPISQLPLDKVREAEAKLEPGIRGQLAIATNRRHCDWELGLEQLRGIDVISFMIPEFQECRQMARMLVLRTRLALAERRFDDAIETMQMNYRMGRDTAQHFLVCGLIGMAIHGMTNATLIELMGQPGSPNMYWALSQLPDPPIDMRPSVSFEMAFGSRMFPFIDNAEKTERSPQEWNRLYLETVRDLQNLGASGIPAAQSKKPTDAEIGVAATGVGVLGYPHAKKRLIEQGMDRERVEKMSVGQVLAIYTERNYRQFADEYENLWQIPFARSNEMANAVEKRLYAARPLGNGEDREILPLNSLLLPALQACRGAETRLCREVASLRVIEALRLYAAKHDGRLPKNLSDIDQVPIPNNPATGKPFVYSVDGTTAILELPASDGIPSSNRRYEIQVVSK